MIKLTIASPNITDGTSYYRCAGPLTRLRQQMPELQIDFPPGFAWHDMKSADIVFFQRPGSEDHFKVMELAKKCGVPIWIDMDDDLLDVPMWNPGWSTFKNRKELIIKIIKQADVVTTATPYLADKIKHHNLNTFVIPNALDERLLVGYDPICKPTEINTIYWRGSVGHVKDVMQVEDDICEVAREFPKIKWEFHGYWPWHTFEKLQRVSNDIEVSCVPSLETIDFFNFFKEGSTHSIGIVPLEDIPWNHYKSNIAWLENTLAGAACLAFDTKEFNQPGCLTYKNGEFKQKLMDLINMDMKSRKLLVQQSLETIEKHYTLSHINKLRQNIIYKLLGKEPYKGHIYEDTSNLNMAE